MGKQFVENENGQFEPAPVTEITKEMFEDILGSRIEDWLWRFMCTRNSGKELHVVWPKRPS